ncbi:hypothetical protein SFC08_02005 [Lysinibacillus halotolerans]
MKFQVGDKLKRIKESSRFFTKGQYYEIVRVGKECVYFKDNMNDIHSWSIDNLREAFEVKPTKNQRITALESVVKDLEQKIIDIRNDYRYDLKQAETRIKMLEFKLEEQTKLIPPTIQSVEEIIEFEGNRYRKVDREAREGDVVIFKNTFSPYLTNGKPYFAEKLDVNTSVGDYRLAVAGSKNINCLVYEPSFNRTTETTDVYELIKQELTPNQQRAEIIEKAKKFVEVKSECVKDSPYVKGGIVRKKIENPNFYNYAAVEVEFIINQEKRTVVSLVKFKDGSIMTKGIAKCNPSDVFNEHIGKAIALGRALGLDVSEFEQAVQPTLAIGQEVRNIWSQNVTRITKTFETSDTNSLGYIQSQGTDYKIINDTNAQYEGDK